MEREMVIDCDDLMQVEVQCPTCGAGILLDLSKGQRVNTTKCPVCGGDTFKEDLISKLDAFVQEAKNSKTTVKFHVKE